MSTETVQAQVPATKEQIENLLEMCFAQGKTDTACKILCDLIFQLKVEVETLKATTVKAEIRNRFD